MRMRLCSLSCLCSGLDERLRGDLMSYQVSTHIDATTKQQFDEVCERIGVSPSNAINMFIKGVINFNGIPFSVVAPEKHQAKHTMSRAEMFGCMRGQFEMTDDFDEPIDDFKEYME